MLTRMYVQGRLQCYFPRRSRTFSHKPFILNKANIEQMTSQKTQCSDEGVSLICMALRMDQMSEDSEPRLLFYQRAQIKVAHMSIASPKHITPTSPASSP